MALFLERAAHVSEIAATFASAFAYGFCFVAFVKYWL
jgi:hypothetical protein